MNCMQSDSAMKRPQERIKAIGRSPDDKIPRIYTLQSAAITAVLLTIEVVLIILTTVILILFLYYRNGGGEVF